MKKKIIVEKPKINWHSENAEFAFNKTNSNEKGIGSEEAKLRQEKFGKNVLPAKKPKSIFLLFFEEIINPIVLVLIVAMAFSFVVGEIVDGFVILGIIMVDAVVGSIQSKKAERIASSLSNMIKVKVKVLRDGIKQEIDSSDLVVGDVVFLESGDKASADMRILECNNFTLDEALLTGESFNVKKQVEPVKKEAVLGDRFNMVYSGSSVITGRAKCLVVGIGKDTEIGQIATSLNVVKDEASPLSIRINKFTKQITLAIVAVSVILFVLMYFQHNPIKDIFLCVIALAVSAMPEGLPLAITMALTIASNRMGKKNVVVKNLNAVESLGSCTVIATDKTGTLTLNEQTAKLVILPDGSEFGITGSGYNDVGEIVCDDKKARKEIEHIALMGKINNEASLKKKDDKFVYYGDSIDVAFLAFAKKADVSDKKITVTAQIPYESENKFSAVFFDDGKIHYCTAKGSVEKILSFSKYVLVDGVKQIIDKKEIEKQNESMAKRGLRVIALASGEIKKEAKIEEEISNLTFLGLVGFIDPIRDDSKQAIKECHEAGIKVVMITGDHPLTAFSIAEEIEIAKDFSDIATGIDVEKEFEKGEKSFDRFVKTKTVFSRVTPTDKLHIVESLKRQGEFVAVTGDGVNDSPAIKAAHIGIAMGSGTDVSKETADMIIVDDKFNSIVEGVKEGRGAYSNIRKITLFLISCAIAEVLFFVLSIAFGTPTPLVAIQLLWLNLVTDGLQDMSLSLEKVGDKIMEEKPRSTKESLFDKQMIVGTCSYGLFMGIVVFLIWFLLIKQFGVETTKARAYVMALMVFLQNFHAFNCRDEKQSIFKFNWKSNWFFYFAVFGSIGLQLLIMEIPVLSGLLKLETVSYVWLLILFGASLSIILVGEILKLFFRKKKY